MPLPRGIMVNSTGIKRWIEFKYEKCLDFCFGCGLVGHSERNCSKRGMDKRMEPQYGNWMRASYPQNPSKRNRNGGGTERVEEEKFQTQDTRKARRGE